MREIEAGAPAAALWSRLDESGFADALLDEERGGAGLALSEAFPLLELCGAHAGPVPLGETMVARALLAGARGEEPEGSIALGCGVATAGGGLRCALVPCGRVADHVLVAHAADAWLLPTATADATAGVFPLDATLEWSSAIVNAARRVPGHDVLALQACICSAQLAGA